MKVCTKCGKDKMNDDFYYRKDSGKYRNECKECVKSIRTSYRKNNKEAVNASNRKSYSGSLTQRLGRKASQWNLKHGGEMTGEQIMRVLTEHGFSCYYCGKQDLWTHVDHVTPICRGGENTPRNIVPACRDCNSRKKHRTEKEFEEYMK